MKVSIYSALTAVIIIASANTYAKPPIPPTSVKVVPEQTVCRDMNALTVEEIDELNNDTDKIISFDEELREICFKKVNQENLRM